MRILLSSNAPWSKTGYGAPVASLLGRLSALGCVGGPQNVAVFAWFGLKGGMMMWGKHLVYPGHGHPYGIDVIGRHAENFKADVVITLIDVWTQEGVAEKVAPAAWLPWFPVDTAPASPRVVESLAGAARPLVFSRFGRQRLREAGVTADYMPLGLEEDVFRILPEEDVAQFRQTLLRDASHVTAMVAANKGFDRKAFQINLRAWAAFAREEPGAVLYIHTDPTTEAAGVDLQELTGTLGIADRVIFPSRHSYYMGFPAEYLALVYNAADVLLASSMTEGFGVPIIEAQACGTPVIVTDFASMPELIRWGTAVSPADLFWVDGLRAWWAWPDWRGIRDALCNAGRMKRASSSERRWAVSGAVHKEFGWDRVMEEHWRPVLEGLGIG